jgi:hypothetical protein
MVVASCSDSHTQKATPRRICLTSLYLPAQQLLVFLIQMKIAFGILHIGAGGRQQACKTSDNPKIKGK